MDAAPATSPSGLSASPPRKRWRGWPSRSRRRRRSRARGGSRARVLPPVCGRCSEPSVVTIIAVHQSALQKSPNAAALEGVHPGPSHDRDQRGECHHVPEVAPSHAPAQRAHPPVHPATTFARRTRPSSRSPRRARSAGTTSETAVSQLRRRYSPGQLRHEQREPEEAAPWRPPTGSPRPRHRPELAPGARGSPICTPPPPGCWSGAKLVTSSPHPDRV